MQAPRVRHLALVSRFRRPRHPEKNKSSVSVPWKKRHRAGRPYSTASPAQTQRLPAEDQKSLAESSRREEMTLSHSIQRPCGMEHISGRRKQHGPHSKPRNSPTLPSDPEASPSVSSRVSHPLEHS